MSFFFSDTTGGGGGGGGIATDYVARWTFEDITGSTVADETANHDGTLSNTSTTTGPDGLTAIDFSGSTSALFQVPDSTDFEFTEGTVSFWAYHPTNASGVLIEKDGNAGWTVQMGGGGAHYRCSRGNDITGMRANSLTAGQWIHVCVVMSDTLSEREIYLNNSAASYQKTYGTPSFGTGELNIGVRPTSTAPFNGYLDLITIYDRVLSASEITALYEEV